MKKGIFKLLLLGAVLVVSGPNSFAQYSWEKYSGNPLIVHGSSGSWNQSVIAPSVIFNSDLNRYEMWFTAYTGATPNPGIGFTYSSDGITWVPPTLVMTPGSASWDLLFVGGVSVIKEGNLYKMWYTAYPPLQIGYATSTDGGINWTKHPDPVLSPSTGWESGSVGYPSVIKVPGGYWMFYMGETSAGISRTGRAFSTDGITWQKDTVHNPVLPPGGAGQWDQNNFLARVVEINNNLYMCYTGESVPGSNSTTAIGFATSVDMGITWLKDVGNPIITQGVPGSWDFGRIETGSILFKDDTLKIYYDGSGSATGDMGRIGLATAPCPLPLATGTYSVGTGGNFETIQDAFDKLDTDGIAGNVTLELIDNLYTAPTDSFGFKLDGPIPGAGPDSRVTIKPAENKNVIIEGSGGATVSFLNTKYLTIDGVSLTGSTTLTIHSLDEGPFTWVNTAVFFPPAANNIVENVTFNNENYSIISTGLAFMSFVNTTSAIDSNLIQNNFIKNASIGIYISGWSGIAEARYNIVRGNVIGSEADSLITWGIQIETNDNSIIENNLIENIKQQFNLDVITHGINICGGNSCIVRNNVVHNVRSSTLLGSTGILLSGGGVFGYGTNNLVYNNMVYNIQSTSVNPDSRIAGIQLWNQINPKIYYNSVSLSGTGGTCPGGSSAFFMTTAGSVTNLEMINNIFVNTRNDSPNCASAICDFSSATFTSNYNDLYFDDTNPANCLVRIYPNEYLTLADWQVTGQDLNSVTEMPSFVDPYLHISESDSTYLESGGIPIIGIETDIDGDQRRTDSTDIGADEFDGIRVPVELTSFTAASNDDEIILNWSTATETNNRGFEVERKVSSQWERIGFVEGFGTTSEPRVYSYTDSKLSVGKYIYRLKQIDFDGSYDYSIEVEAEVNVPLEFTLKQNYPNPFNPNTIIRYQLPVSCKVTIKVFDILGNEVATLVNEIKDAGRYEVVFNPISLSSGVYFYKINAGEYTAVKKMLLIK